MPKFIDRTGAVFGRLRVVKRVGVNASKKVLWECLCDCGRTTTADICALVTGNTTSCGCYLKERITKHGGCKKGSYNTWRAMMRRCYNPKDKDYRKYGDVGVTVHGPWHDYTCFAQDVGEPIDSQTLDRVDTYGNYAPGNVRWATPLVQNRNVRVRKGSASGHTGVYAAGSKWFARIKAAGKQYYSRGFFTVDEAVAARKQLELLHWA